MGEQDKLITVDDSFGFFEEELVDKLEPFDPDDPYNRKLFDYRDIENFYQRVTSCMGIGEGTITEDVIDFPENAPTAERRVKSIIPDWKLIDYDKFELFKSCIVFMTCYILCPMARMKGNISQQTTPSLTLKYSDNIELPPCDHYLDLMNQLASEILDEPTESFYGFRVTRPSCDGIHGKRHHRF